MTSLRAHIGNLLAAAEQGQAPNDDDLGLLPAAIADDVRTASNRLVALAASGDQLPARNERRQALDDITDAMLAAGYDPTSAAPHNPTDRQAIREAINGSPSPTRTMIEGLPR